MTLSYHDSEKLLDKAGRIILSLLQEDARLSYSEIGRRVGLSSPAVAERVRRMEEAGIITGYHARVNPDLLGYTVTAYIQVTSGDGRCDLIHRFAQKHVNITECCCIAGDRDVLIKALFKSLAEVDDLVQQLLHYGKVSTSIVLRTYMTRQLEVQSLSDSEASE